MAKIKIKFSGPKMVGPQTTRPRSRPTNMRFEKGELMGDAPLPANTRSVTPAQREDYFKRKNYVRNNSMKKASGLGPQTTKPSSKQEGRFEGAGRRGGAAIDSGLNRAGYAAKRGVASVKNAVRATGRSVINAGNDVVNKAKMAGAYAKKKERSAAYQVGKLITGQTKNQNANRRAGRIGYAGIAATGTAIGSVGAHIANRSREGNPSKPSMGNETSQNYNSSSWSAHKKTQRGY